jgi:pimeloyl-ACP methyl ester carboxylesterase
MLQDRGIRMTFSRLVLVAVVALSACSALVPSASAKEQRPPKRGRARTVTVRRKVLKVPESRSEASAETISTPQLGRKTLDKIAIIKIKPKGEAAPNVLVLEPGTSAAAAYFVPFAKSLVEATPGWQVWAVERRENFLEDQNELTKYKFGELPAEELNPNTGKDETPPEQFFNYYLGYLGQDQQEATAEVIAKYVDTGLLAKEVSEKYSPNIAEEAIKQADKELAEGKITSEELKQRIGEDAGPIGQKYGEKLAAEKGEAIFNELVAKFHNHYEPVPNSLVEFAKNWGMARTVEDLNVVIKKAKALGGKVVLGGHSLGGSVVTAYATWDFSGHPGAEGLSGLVFDDGGSSPAAISEAEAKASLAKLDEPNETPWLAFGGIVAPDLGLFSITGSTLTSVEPKGPSQLESFPFLPADLRSPIVPVTNEAGFGYSVNVGTSPESLIAAQIHGGQGVEETAEGDGLHGWNGSGALTPVSRYAGMLSGAGLRQVNGSEWYFPARLTLDTGAVGNGLENPAQKVLGLHSTMGEDLPRSLHILAIDSELDKIFGGEGTSLTEAKLLAEQSHISTEECSASTSEGCLTLIEEKNSYAHNDPAGATPALNEFFKHMVPYLKEIAG